jgi:hypothetical protein
LHHVLDLLRDDPAEAVGAEVEDGEVVHTTSRVSIAGTLVPGTLQFSL